MTEPTKTPRELWIEALRSGEYPQTRGVLRDSNGFCCLGVACDLYAKAHPDFPTEWKEDYSANLPRYSFILGFEGDRGASLYLPEEVQEWLGLCTRQGFSKYSEIVDHDKDDPGLSGLNDSGKSFAEIADILEQEAHHYFNPAPQEV